MFENLKSARTTGIGSLPHQDVDAALKCAFQTGIPFLPQLPRRNLLESMIPQALEGLPGLHLENSGRVQLTFSVWKNHSQKLNTRLHQIFPEPWNLSSQLFALSDSKRWDEFEPSPRASSCWRPFLQELVKRGLKTAKIQLAGPFTCLWALPPPEDTPPHLTTELNNQIFLLIFARSIAMVRRMLSHEIQPVLYLDEPGLYAFSSQNSKHILALQQLQAMIQTLRQEGAIVGIHCCSQTQWNSVFGLGADLVSIDVQLSLKDLFANDGFAQAPIEPFINQGGRLSLGIIPTDSSSSTQFFRMTRQEDFAVPQAPPCLWKSVLNNAVFTPACGLAQKSMSEAEFILSKLGEVYEHFFSE